MEGRMMQIALETNELNIAAPERDGVDDDQAGGDM